MTIIGFTFTKILVEKKLTQASNVQIKNNVNITNIKLQDFPADAKKSVLVFSFLFTSKYDPELGIIEIHSEMLDLEDKALATSFVEDWRKRKALPHEIMNTILNNVLSKCNIEAILLSREVGLPSPIPLPKVDVHSRPNVAEAKPEAKPDVKDAKPAVKKK